MVTAWGVTRAMSARLGGLLRKSAWPLLLFAAAGWAATLHVHTGAQRSLTSLEDALFTVIYFGLGFAGSFLVGRIAATDAAIREVRAQARPALRRIVSLAKALERLGERVRAEETDLRLAQSQGDSIEPAASLESLRRVHVVVEEHIAVVYDSIEDWRDILPAEFGALQEIATLRNEYEELRQALSAAQEATAADAADRERVKQQVGEIESQLADTRRRLGEARRRSSVVALTPTTTLEPSRSKVVPVPLDFPSAYKSSPMGIQQGSALSGFSKLLSGPRCSVCGATENKLLGMGLTGEGAYCRACGLYACSSHVTSRAADGDGPRCLTCWKADAVGEAQPSE